MKLEKYLVIVMLSITLATAHFASPAVPNGFEAELELLL